MPKTMETKHTKEYAMLCAKLCSNQLAEELTPFELIVFESGYMKAIEETNVAELLEACNKAFTLCDKLQMPTESELKELKLILIKAIKKASEFHA